MRRKKQTSGPSNSRLVGVALIVLLSIALVGVLVRAVFHGRSAPSYPVSPPPRMTPTRFSGGAFEASGVVQVPGTDAVLFVDDDRPSEVFWMQLGADRKQAGAIQAIDIGTRVIDPEGITSDGEYFYVVGSQSKSEGLAGLARFKFDAASHGVTAIQTASRLKKFLADNVLELRGLENANYYDGGGINIEGIAWDPLHERLLLGLRSPVVENSALIVSLKFRDSKAALSVDNLEVEGHRALRLPLGGGGIRSIDYDESRKVFYIISGAGPDTEKMDFKLWEWNGDESPPALRELRTFDRHLKPEGLTRFSTNRQSFLFIVFDTSGYTDLD